MLFDAAPKTNTNVNFNATETEPAADTSSSTVEVLTAAVDKQMSGLQKHISKALARVRSKRPCMLHPATV
jgi:hypothetical protein